MALAIYERQWMREMRGRSSWLPWRRRKARAACLALIRARDADLGYTPDPWTPRPPPKPGALPVSADPNLVNWVTII